MFSLALHSLGTSATVGNLNSIVKANAIANESSWTLFEDWVKSRAQETVFPLRWMNGLLLARSLSGQIWEDLQGVVISGKWQSHSWAQRWSEEQLNHQIWLVQLPLATWGLLCRPPLAVSPIFWANTLFFSVSPNTGFWDHKCALLLVENMFPSLGSDSGLDGQWQNSVRIVFSVSQIYQVSIRNRWFLYSGHSVVCFEIFILEDNSL